MRRNKRKAWCGFFLYAYQSGLSNQFLNNALFQFLNSSQNFGFKWNGRVAQNFRYDYNINLQSFKSKPKEILTGLNTFEVQNTNQNLSIESFGTGTTRADHLSVVYTA